MPGKVPTAEVQKGPRPSLYPAQSGPIQSISQVRAGVHQLLSCVQGLFGKAIEWAKAFAGGHWLWTVVQQCLGCLTATNPAK